MMMRGSHQPPLRRGLSTLRCRARRGWAVWRPRLRLVRTGAAEASGAAGSAEAGSPPARRPLSRRLSTRPVMRLAPASSMSWGSSSMMVGRGRTPSNWPTMKAAAAPSRWYLPESESNSIGWLSIPTMRLTPRRRRGIGLVGRLPGIVGVVLAVLITVLIVGSWLPQVGSRGSGVPPSGGQGTEVPYPPPWGRQQDVVDALAAQAGHEAEAALAGHEAEAALAGQDALAWLKAQPRALPSGSSSTPKSLSARVRSIELFVICCSPPSLRCLVGRSGARSGPRGPVCRDRAPTPRTGWSVELCDAVCSSGSVWQVGRRRSRRAGRD